MRPLTITMATLAAALLATPLVAQEGGPPDRPDRRERGQRFDRPAQLSGEQAKAAWTLEAGHVAGQLGLGEEQTGQLVAAYTSARQEFADARPQLVLGGDDETDEPGRGRGRGARGRGSFAGFGMNAEMIEKHRDMLQKSISGFLTEKQVERAMASLGTFNAGWDRMVHAVSQLELADEAGAKAHEAIEQYVIAVGKARDTDDRMAMRETMSEARQTLQEKLEALLDENQMRRFRRSTMMRQGRGDMSARLLQFDANGDGKLQRDEVPERMQQIFERLDRNGDGVIERSEMGGRLRRGPDGELPEIF